jgi:RNA polymerase sigma-70 factor, ECF subfamily
VSSRSASLSSCATALGNLGRGARGSGLKARAVSKVADTGAGAGGDDSAERKLIEAAQRDPARFADLYQANFERVYAYIARRVRDRDEAQDLTADVFHLALKSIARFEWRGVPFAAWLFRIASNEIADRSKSVTVAKRRTSFLQESDAGGEMAASMDDAERRARLFKLVERLPRDQSRVIAMRFAEDKSIREIAAVLGRSEGSIKQLQFRGLQNLRVRLGDSNG